MPRVCTITKKRPQVGHKVSHSNIKTKKRFDINLHSKRIYLEKKKRFVRLKISAKALRTIDKLGVEKLITKSKKIDS